MHILPTSRQEWLSLLLFPFKAYVVIVLIWTFVWKLEPFGVRAAQMQATDYILAGYAACVFVLLFAGIIQFIAHHRRSAVTSVVFAVAAFIALVFLLPIFALAK